MANYKRVGGNNGVHLYLHSLKIWCLDYDAMCACDIYNTDANQMGGKELFDYLKNNGFVVPDENNLTDETMPNTYNLIGSSNFYRMAAYGSYSINFYGAGNSSSVTRFNYQNTKDYDIFDKVIQIF